MLLALGMYVFSTDTTTFNQLQRRRTWRHPSSERVNARPASQFAGPGDDIITLPGFLAPGLNGSRDALEQLAKLADAGGALTLVDGAGYNYGAYLITDLDETKRRIMVDGQARAIDFSLSLKRADDDLMQQPAPGQSSAI